MEFLQTLLRCHFSGRVAKYRLFFLRLVNFEIINTHYLFFIQLERELVMDLERLKLAKSVKPKRSRDKVINL